MCIFKSEAAAVSQRYLLVRIVMYCAEAQSDVIFATGTREADITEKAHLLSDVLRLLTKPVSCLRWALSVI